MGQKKTGGEVEQQKTRRRVFLTGLLVIVLFAGVQTFMLLTGSGAVLPDLDPAQVYTLQVTRVLDPELPALSRQEFARFLKKLEEDLNRFSHVKVRLEHARSVLAGTLFNDSSEQFSGAGAARWFNRNSFVGRVQCNETGYSRTTNTLLQGKWIDRVLDDTNRRAQLAVYYRSGTLHGLRDRLLKDFRVKFRRNLAWKNRYGSGYLAAKERWCYSSAAYWSYLLGSQVRSDLIVSNIPVFFPAAVSTAGALTRGGLSLFLTAPVKRQLGEAVMFSTAPLLRGKRLTAEQCARLALQPLMGVVQRRPLTLADSGSLFYPVLGEQYRNWLTDHGARSGTNGSSVR